MTPSRAAVRAQSSRGDRDAGITAWTGTGAVKDDLAVRLHRFLTAEAFSVDRCGSDAEFG